VDSGSTDDSVSLAERSRAAVVNLDMSIAFTAARARNAGFDRLLSDHPETVYVQFLDGDCTIDPDWIARAREFLEAQPGVALVCGRRRERFPERSIYNKACDQEWAGPPGEIEECGGDFLIRAGCFREVGGFADELIAGEEPELCIRLRSAGWKLWRLDLEMCLHDAAIFHFGQWWKRSVRTGHAYAEVSSLHRGSPYAIWHDKVRRSALYGGVIPLTVAVGSILSPLALIALTFYPLQLARIWLRNAAARKTDWRLCLLVVAGKFPEFQGVSKFYLSKLRNRRSAIIEYK